ncbi:MAG: SURF1 family protein [Ilumatobacteraceae bacterium]|nr:SURF1 family protein [Acidimicrobiales bacterium]MCB9394325.1 SURF1 family protein [Acidimicrobiaceae bacterium]
MYRFLLRPRWLGFHLLVVAAVVGMVMLGLWQLGRWEDRKDFNAEVRDRAAEPVVSIEEIATVDVEPDIVQWRTVTATGTYLPDEQVVVVNLSQQGASGVGVVTPFELGDGTLLLVNRGFVPDAAEVPAPPVGTVELTGRLRASQERRLGGLTEGDGELDEVFRIDVPRLAEQLPGPVLPVYLDLLASDPSEGDLPIPVPDPDLTEGPHLSYMVQWWIFATAVAIGWVLAVRRSVRQHRIDVGSSPGEPAAPPVSAAAGRTPPDSPPPAAS